MTRPVALVTGGSRGIGAATVLALAEAGYDVAFCYLAAAERAATVRERALAAGGRVRADQLDVTDPDAVTRYVRDVEAALGPVAAAVTSAGVTRDRAAVTMTDEDWATVVRTNLDGTFHVCRAVLFGMVKRRAGAVVTLSSIAGRDGNQGQGNYAASKAAITAFTQSAAREVGRYGVRINAVAPGLIDTEMTDGMPEAVLARTMPRIPLGRVGAAAEVAELICFLLSDRASYITGQNLGIDGGLVL
jgi:3-oxoacyl-[acyl-carrier protein] reductase